MAAGHGGQVLVSETTERLVTGDERTLEGISLADRGRYRLKDFEQGVRLYELVGAGLREGFPALRAERIAPPKRRRLIIALAGLVLAAAVGVAVILAWTGRAGVVPPNSLAVIDPQRNKVVATIGVGIRPGPIAVGEGSVWVGNLQDETLSRADPDTAAVSQTIPLDEAPLDVTVASGSVWVAYGRPLRVAQLAPGGNRASVTATYHAICAGCSATFQRQQRRSDNEIEARGIVFGGGFLWTIGTLPPRPESMLFGVDASSARIIGSNEFAFTHASGVAVGKGTVWIAASGDDGVWEVNERTDNVTGKITVGDGPSDLAFGDGSLWVTTRGRSRASIHAPTRWSPRSASATRPRESRWVQGASG